MCKKFQPPPTVCHVCGAEGRPGDFWRSLTGKDLPDEGPEAAVIRSAASEVGFDEGRLRKDGLRDFFSRHSVTSREEREEWAKTMQAYFSAYKSGLDLAMWELTHPEK